MISKSYFFIIIFVSFLVTPFVVSILQQDDYDYALTISEEEKSADGTYDFEKDLKVKQDFVVYYYEQSERFLQPTFYQGFLLSSGYLDPVFPPPKSI
ncbi:hypothetical protein DSM03_101767 [Leeuwenhoekiella aestuarii]|uniref:Uncharacterized protein n=1 Tax=Leeuwenhoekiella aestuarii TaxID=2249426 RepID=A0A4Q0NZ47_9FLAO|nr:hypothetical protein DSM04_101275 [Leeuwenhoekiella aestuarii]RXG19393.1 hypothetical protein DSM03_101767 [Leeuwenhoekiella aestuarii]